MNELKFKRENDEGIPLTPAESRKILALIFGMFLALCGIVYKLGEFFFGWMF